jgi:hypothetical protein
VLQEKDGMTDLSTMREWQPSAILSFTEPVRPHALIILNQNINRVDILKKIWAGGKATVDECNPHISL